MLKVKGNNISVITIVSLAMTENYSKCPIIR